MTVLLTETDALTPPTAAPAPAAVTTHAEHPQSKRDAYIMAAVMVCGFIAYPANTLREYYNSQHSIAKSIANLASDSFQYCTAHNLHGYYWTRKTGPHEFTSFRIGYKPKPIAKVFRPGIVIKTDPTIVTAQMGRYIEYVTTMKGTHPATVTVKADWQGAPATLWRHLNACAEIAQDDARKLQGWYPEPRWYHAFPMLGKIKKSIFG
jgi:hypothetical protein